MSRTAEMRRGWLIVLTAMMGAGLGVSSISVYTNGLFIEPLERASGWSRAWISGGSAAMTLGIALSSPLVGRVVDRFGARPTAAGSMLVLAGGYAALSLSPLHPVIFVSALFMLGFLASGCTPITFTKVVNSWFAEARGLALGLTLTGSGLVGILAPLLLGPLITDYGWRVGYAAIAAVVATVVPIVWFGLRGQTSGEPQKQPASTEGTAFKDALRDRDLWIMAGSFALAAMGIAGVVVHYVPILTSAGVTRSAALHSASFLGLSVILSRLCTGIALDRFSAPFIGSLVFAAATGGCVMLLFGGVSIYWGAGVLISFAMGTEVDLVAYMVARRFGLRAYGRIFGLLFGLLLLGAASGPLLFGILFDISGDYTAAIQVASLLIACAAGLPLLLLRGRSKTAWVNISR